MFIYMQSMTNTLFKYGFMRIAVASPELKVADIGFNTSHIISAIETSVNNGANLILFPELSITGYTCADLFYQRSLLNKSMDALFIIANSTAQNNCTVVVGAPIDVNGKLFNCAVLISNGIICGIVPKTYLPNANEYYEQRWFSSEFDRINEHITFQSNNNLIENIPFGADLLFQVEDLPECVIGIEICEDLWTVNPPSQNMALAGATLLLNLSAGDETLGKQEYRRGLVKSQSARCLSAYAYSSAGPGESSTDLVFPGHCIIAENGIIISETERFQFDTQIAYADIDMQRLYSERLKNSSFSTSFPDKQFRKIILNISDTEIESDKVLLRKITKTPFVPSDESLRSTNCKEIFSIQTTALAKRIRHINCKDTVIGVSGGLDSTLALLVICKTYEKLGLDKKGIHAISMPGFGTTQRTKSNAEQLSELLGIDFRTIPINDAVNQHFKDIDHDSAVLDITYENSQARERTQILMDLSNKFNAIVIGTGDLSELALGWSTYNGDHMSMYGVNSGVPKTLVKYIVQWCADTEFSPDQNRGESAISKILYDIIATPISPELLPADDNGKIAQKTENEIGPYLLHDFFLYYVVRFGFAPSKIVFLAGQAFVGVYSTSEIIEYLKIFYKRFFANQFKRSCLPDGVKVGSVTLSPRGDWRMPSDASSDLWLRELESIN
jgi:NAD+ synthase (glutamine-hydrolysing)